MVYVAAGVGSIALVTGFTLGSIGFGFGSFEYVPAQGSASGLAPGSPVGLAFTLAEQELVSPTTTPATGNCTATNLGTSAMPNVLVSGASIPICLSASAGGFATGDSMWIIDISFNTSAFPSAVYNLTVFEATSPASHQILDTVWIETSASITSTETVVLAVDLTQSSDSSVPQWSVIATLIPP
jgi:hypothetical protein